MSPLPTYCIPFNKFHSSQLPHDIKTLRTMMHSVRGKVNQSSAKWLSPWRILKVINEELILPPFLHDLSTQRKQLLSDNIQAIRKL